MEETYELHLTANEMNVIQQMLTKVDPTDMFAECGSIREKINAIAAAEKTKAEAKAEEAPVEASE